MSNWRDPSWRNLKDVKGGLEGDTRDARGGLFGENVINIEEKPIFKLLIDEVASTPLNLITGITSVLHIPSILHYPLVDGRVLLLCNMHFYHQCYIGFLHSHRNASDNASNA